MLEKRRRMCSQVENFTQLPLVVSLYTRLLWCVLMMMMMMESSLECSNVIEPSSLRRFKKSCKIHFKSIRSMCVYIAEKLANGMKWEWRFEPERQVMCGRGGRTTTTSCSHDLFFFSLFVTEALLIEKRKKALEDMGFCADCWWNERILSTPLSGIVVHVNT